MLKKRQVSNFYLAFICLFNDFINDPVNSSDYLASNDRTISGKDVEGSGSRLI
jgi:hypothetical protein